MQLVIIILSFAKALLDFFLEIRKRRSEALERVKTAEKENTDVAEAIHKKDGKKLAQWARTRRAVIRELLRDPKLRQDMERASARGRVVPKGSKLPESGRPDEETILLPPTGGGGTP